jgi:hypothetical protein
MSKIQEILDYNPGFWKPYCGDFEIGEIWIDYDKSFYCSENKIIHPNVKSVLSCKYCITEKDKEEHEKLLNGQA